MVHNGIEYGMMASLAEGLNILHNANAGTRSAEADAETAPMEEPEYYQFDIDTTAVAEVWRRGSVVGSWLLDLTAAALFDSPDLRGVRWTGIGFRGRQVDLDRGDRRRRPCTGTHQRPLLTLFIQGPRRFR